MPTKPRLDLAHAAALYLDSGLAVLPARRQKKKPAVPTWNQFRSTLPTREEIDAWFVDATPDALCIVCGAVSGNFEVLDFDQKAALFEAWSAIVRDEAPGLLERLVIERSQSGGIHVLYRSTEPVGGNTVLAAVADGAGRTTLIETRGEGGLILCAPTPGYELLHGQLHALPVLDRDEVETLRTAASALDRRAPVIVDGPAPRTPREREDRPGDRFNREGDIRPVLVASGWRLWRPGDNESWTRPGKSEGGSATFNGNCFFVHSSSAPPFEPGKGYSKFAVLALLEHGGDFTKAARAVRTDLGAVQTTPFVEVDDLPELNDSEAFASAPLLLREDLMRVPGFIDMVMEYHLSVAPRPNRAMAFAAAICLQAVLAARRVAESGGNRTNLMVIAVAPSGAGKECGRQVNRRILSAAGLAHLEGPEDLASDAGLLNAVAEQPGLLLQLDEIGRMLRTTGDSKRSPHLFNVPTTLMRLYTSAGSTYQGKAYAEGSRRKRIDFPCAVIHGTTVPDHLAAGLTIDALTDGFLGRTLLVINDETPARQRPRDRDLPEPVIHTARWWGAFNPAAGTPGAEFTPFVVGCTSEAEQVFDRLGQEVDSRLNAEDRAGQALYARVEEKARKLALIHACSVVALQPAESRERHLRIGSESAEWGAELSMHLTECTLRFARRHVVSSPFEAMQNRILEAIRKRGGSISRSQLTRDTQSLTVKERNAVLENLTEAGRVREHSRETGTKPATWYELVEG